MRLAAVDCGTNTVRLLIAEVDSTGTVRSDVVRTSTIVRLGESVDRMGRLISPALERTKKALVRYRAHLDKSAVDRVRVVATSAIRDAANASEFTDIVMSTVGVTPEVITGDEEAHLSYQGALRGFTGGQLAGQPPYLVVDIGGGSTELIVGEDAQTVTRAASVNLGSVRMTERHVHSDPPSDAERAELRTQVRSALRHAEPVLHFSAAPTVVGVAGTVITLAGLAVGAVQYEPMLGHGVYMDIDTVAALADTLTTTTHAQRTAMRVIEPGRVDIIGAGAVILHEVLAACNAPGVITSEYDILDGIVADMLGGCSY